MRIQQLLDHHGIATNPFTEEDAQADPVFKQHCIGSTFHPTWDKIYGDPGEPATSIVFGEKGCGKTAMRLQVVRHLDRHNRAHPQQRIWVIEYDDFNPFLDRFRDRLPTRRRSPEQVLSQWKLWDHMDAILALGVTGLVDRILDAHRVTGSAENEVRADEIHQLDHHQSRDLLLLAACYDQSSAETPQGRWNRLRQTLGFATWKNHWDLALGVLGTIGVVGLIAMLGAWNWLATLWPYLVILLFWLVWLRRLARCARLAWAITGQVRSGNHEKGPLTQVLMHFPMRELANQPLPVHERTDDRYALLAKFQDILTTLGYRGVVVVVDRVDEPHLINGSAELMRQLVWSMLDNKFLKSPGLGVKMLLPVELTQFLDREDRDFYQRARLDKQNMIRSLDWTPEALWDMTDARIKVCAAPGHTPTFRELFDPAISDGRLTDMLRLVRVPRHLFKLMYRLLVAHANAYSEKDPRWTISSETFEGVLAVYRQQQDAFDRGLQPG